MSRARPTWRHRPSMPSTTSTVDPERDWRRYDPRPAGIGRRSAGALAIPRVGSRPRRRAASGVVASIAGASLCDVYRGHQRDPGGGLGGVSATEARTGSAASGRHRGQHRTKVTGDAQASLACRGHGRRPARPLRDGPDRELAAELRGLAFRTAFARWADPANQREFAELTLDALFELKTATAALGMTAGALQSRPRYVDRVAAAEPAAGARGG
jgi:hypothetical protein